MKLILNLLLTLFLVFSSILLLGQISDIRIREISPPGGFALKAIYSIEQDELGYIWMGTRQGLMQYHSNSTKWFTPSSNDSSSLPSEIINDIYIGKNNTVWIATNRGLCTFDRQKQAFNQIKYTYEDGTTSEARIISVIEDGKNRLLVLNSDYFGYLDFTSNKLIRLGTNTLKSPNTLYKDYYNRIWIGTNSGEVYRFDPSTNNIVKVVEACGVRVNSIYAENKQIWVGFEGAGAQAYSLKGELIKHYSFNQDQDNNSKTGTVRVINRDTYGRLWFGTYEGLFMYDGEQLRNFSQDNYPDLPHNSIYEIFEDKQGGLWIGTWSGGLALIHYTDNKFRTYRHSQSNNSISDNKVSSFVQWGKNEILIGTEVGGLNSFNLNTEKFEDIYVDEKRKVDNIKALCKDKYGGIWIGTFKRGLWYRPAGSSKFKSFEEGPEDGRHVSSSNIYSLCAVDSGIWIGTSNAGVNFYNFETESVRYCFEKNSEGIDMSSLRVQCVYEDSGSNLWIGTLDGLYKMFLPSREVKKIGRNIYASNLEYSTVFNIWEHSSGDIWIGGKNNGILIYHPKSEKFEVFNAEGLLEGKDVYGMMEDQVKKIWITSNNGLIVHDPNNKTNRHFVFSDGIQSNLFSPQSIYKDDMENLYLGGTNGFTVINPTKVKINSKKPLTIIHEIITKNNHSIYPRYSENLEIDKIFLDPEETNLQVNFSADNYLWPEKNKYKYRLINYYDEWIETNEGSVMVAGLKAGEYIFEVKACNNDGIWNDEPTQVQIEIENYWYRTSIAYFAYFLMFASLLYFIGRFYFEQVKLKKTILLEKAQRENEEQIHEMKLKFFTNISHEFRTPLTLISWPLKRLLSAQNITKEQRDELEVVNRNSNRLLQLINQIIDLRKIENGKRKLNISKFDLIEFIKELQQDFSSEAKFKQIDFILESSYSSLEIEADKEKLDTIIYNLLSNAYKYIAEKGQLKISVSKEFNSSSKSYTNQLSFGEIESDDFIVISVEDSGSGIDSEDLSNIFNRFEQGKHKVTTESDEIKGSGIGLSVCKEYTFLHRGKITAQSDPGKGSRFTIFLPSKQKIQKIIYESHKDFNNLKNVEFASINNEKEKTPIISSSILIVEDNTDFRNFLYTSLKKHYQVECASNGKEALTILQKNTVELVLSDVMMPEMDGFEFCSILKTQIETSHIPVILLTALSSSENLIAGLDKGADAYLTKPFDENVLLKQIENILLQRKRIRENFSQQFISEKTVEVGSLDNFFLKRVKTVVEKNISDESFGMENLAEELMISRTHLHRKIKSLTGVSTTEFVNLIRIKKAIELIKKENYLFSEVAYQVGFNSQSYFTKCFKKVYGVAPKEYFKSLKNH
jgi:signal transduction histidine kinase/ligand-binding sensor domain-containing protein/DNA-binding response OmpR family regulator